MGPLVVGLPSVVVAVAAVLEKWRAVVVAWTAAGWRRGIDYVEQEGDEGDEMGDKEVDGVDEEEEADARTGASAEPHEAETRRWACLGPTRRLEGRFR